jgi:hypothetical protein
MAQYDVAPADTANYDAKKQEQIDIIAASDKTISDINNKKIPATQTAEDSNKKFFDKQNTIIISYEAELTALNGVIITSPIVEQDIIDRSNFTGRLWDPAQVEKELIRIPEFDGGGTTTNIDSESTRAASAPYSAILNRLTAGLTTTTAVSGAVQGSITPVSTSFNVAFNASALAGKEFIAWGGGKSFIGLCSTVTDNGVDVPIPIPPTAWVVNFTFISTFTGTLTGGQFTGIWGGFTNTERTNKISTVPTAGARQTVLNYYVTQLQNHINAQLGFLNSEKSALQGNIDPALPPTALANVNSAITNYQNYLTTTDISNSGISGLTTLNTNSQTRISARITELTGNRLPFFDKRYFWSVERSGSAGALVQIKQLQKATVAAGNRKVVAQNKLATLNTNMF